MEDCLEGVEVCFVEVCFAAVLLLEWRVSSCGLSSTTFTE